MALPVLRLVRRSEIFPYTRADLAFFPDGSLGKDLAAFLDERDLQLLAYYARHDMKHILLDYDTTDEGEGSLQCFMLGNGHLSFPVIATVLYAIFTMPEYWPTFRKAYKRGRRANRIAQWKWAELVGEQTETLKKKIDNH
jgi:ubiquinone biosynthesis protein Coq4